MPIVALDALSVPVETLLLIMFNVVTLTLITLPLTSKSLPTVKLDEMFILLILIPPTVILELTILLAVKVLDATLDALRVDVVIPVLMIFVLYKVPTVAPDAPIDAALTKELTKVPALTVPVILAPPETSKAVDGAGLKIPILPAV